MAVYFDDDSTHLRLKSYLEGEGIPVVLPVDLEQRGMPDPVHFTSTKERGLRLVTRNRRDYEALLQQDGEHPGIYVWNLENDVSRDLSWIQVGRIIQKFETDGDLDQYWGSPPIIDLAQFRWLLDTETDVRPEAD